MKNIHDDLGKMLLLTGQRLGEVVNMTDSEVRGDLWHLAADRTKNGRAHDVPLSAAAQEVLAAVDRLDGDTKYFSRQQVKAHYEAITRAAIIWRTE